MAEIAMEVVRIYRTVINEDTSRKYQGCGRGNARGQCNLVGGTVAQGGTPQSLFDRVSLSFGSKEIQASAKSAFLRRLIGIKLGQIDRLARELARDQSEKPKQGVSQSLRTLISEVTDSVNITAGMLSTLD